MTAGPGPRVAALLRLLRDVAGEIVVALDDRADAETERELSAAADRVIRYPYREPVDRPLRWLFGQCTGRWVLNLDDDEIPGAELLAVLPSLVAASDVTHYWVLRRWLWPDAGSSIAEHPWSTDYQGRLVRNDPALLSFPSEVHRPLEVLGPHRYLRAPIYHASLLVASREQRLEKARRYEAFRPFLRVAGGPMDRVFFFPEERTGLGLEPLPEDDARIVREVLSAPPREAAGVARCDNATADEIDRVWAGRELGPADRRAGLELLDEPRTLRAAEQRTFDVEVENRGGASWPPGERGDPEIRLSYQWLRPDGGLLEYGLRTPLPAELAPGERQVVPVHVRAPDRAGRYRLRFDLVQEQVAWFGCDVDREVEVRPTPRVALVGGDPEPILARLVHEAPEFEPVVLVSVPPAQRFGPPTAPDLREYLLHDTVAGRWADWLPILARTAALRHAVARRRRGREVRPLLHGGEAFLDTLTASTHLLLVAPARRGLRERWLEHETIHAARRLGLSVARPTPADLGLR